MMRWTTQAPAAADRGRRRLPKGEKSVGSGWRVCEKCAAKFRCNVLSVLWYRCERVFAKKIPYERTCVQVCGECTRAGNV